MSTQFNFLTCYQGSVLSTQAYIRPHGQLVSSDLLSVPGRYFISNLKKNVLYLLCSLRAEAAASLLLFHSSLSFFLSYCCTKVGLALLAQKSINHDERDCCSFHKWGVT